MSGEELLASCKEALSLAGEAHAEVYASLRHRGCARIGSGDIAQHMELEEPLVVVRVARGVRVAEAQTSDLRPRAIADAVARAAAAAPLLPETEGFPGFAPAGEPAAKPVRFAEDTARATPEQRVELLAPVLARVREAGLVAAGMLESQRAAVAVATTEGCARSHDETVASFKVWALETPGAGGAAGYGAHAHRSLAALDLQAETERAVRMCALAKSPMELEAGRYDVVLEPAAVTELLEWLAQIGFGAPEVEQGSSPMKLGERIVRDPGGERVTLIDDATDSTLGDDPALGFGVPFDREGTARKPVALVERGVAKNILYDRTYAARAGTVSTGSAQFGEVGGGGAIGTSTLLMEGGDAGSTEELVAGMERGLYVCRLHYVNGLLETPRAMMTGLTRDGCFLVERGKITRAVGNMRFTDSLLEGLARCDGMTRERRAVPTWWSDGGCVIAPAVRMRAFTFTGRSQRPMTL